MLDTGFPGEPEVEPTPSKPTRRVLLADDQELVRRSTARLLEQLGFEVTSAADGFEALEAFEASPLLFDAVILDVGMPRLSGVETLRRLRETQPGLRALLVSGRPIDEPDAPSSSHLEKPYDLAELRQALTDLLA